MDGAERALLVFSGDAIQHASDASHANFVPTSRIMLLIMSYHVS